MLFLAYGVGLDPRQALLFGPRLGPLLVGMSLGLVSFASTGMAPGYTGAQMNPARCFAFGIARRDLVCKLGPSTSEKLSQAAYHSPLWCDRRQLDLVGRPCGCIYDVSANVQPGTASSCGQVKET